MADSIVERYRDRTLLVVDKPPGLPTQATRDGEHGLFERLRAVESYVGLHHRLDRPASGLVLFTLDDAVNAGIAQALRTHQIGRSYRAVALGQIDSGTWNTPLDGQPARTDVQVLGARNGMCALELALHTGRTHQIRKHAAMAGAPLLGDRRYGGDAARLWPRLALHAAQLSFDHPVTGKRLVIDSPLPADLASLWDQVVGSSGQGRQSPQES